jgi:hypothetical protein
MPRLPLKAQLSEIRSSVARLRENIDLINRHALMVATG